MRWVPRNRGSRGAWLAAALALGALAGWFVFHALVGGVADPLAPSGAEETVLRTLRLAGVERAVVAFASDSAMLRVDLSAPSSAADVEIAWQTAFGVLAGTDDRSDRYVVQLFADGAPLLEMEAIGEDARSAVHGDDPTGLREALSLTFIAQSSGVAEVPASVQHGSMVGTAPVADVARAEELMARAPEGATAIPERAVAIDTHLSGAYLDAKNRAAALLGDEGPSDEVAARLASAADAMRLSGLVVLAPGPGDSALGRFLARLDVALSGSRAEGIGELEAEVEELARRGDRESAARIRSLLLAAEAFAAKGSGGSLLADTAEVARRVRTTPLEQGPAADALLAAADSPDAPASSVNVREFERDASLDMTLAQVATGAALPARVLRLHARGTNPPELAWEGDEGRATVAAEVWQGYRRADGAIFWLAGQDGVFALTEGSVRGWAFARSRSALVEAARCGRILAYFGTE